MFRVSSAYLQEDTVVYMQHMVLSVQHMVLSVPYAVLTVPYAACLQLYPPEDEHLRLEICRGD